MGKFFFCKCKLYHQQISDDTFSKIKKKSRYISPQKPKKYDSILINNFFLLRHFSISYKSVRRMLFSSLKNLLFLPDFSYYLFFNRSMDKIIKKPNEFLKFFSSCIINNTNFFYLETESIMIFFFLILNEVPSNFFVSINQNTA